MGLNKFTIPFQTEYHPYDPGNILNLPEESDYIIEMLNGDKSYDVYGFGHIFEDQKTGKTVPGTARYMVNKNGVKTMVIDIMTAEKTMPDFLNIGHSYASGGMGYPQIRIENALV